MGWLRRRRDRAFDERAARAARTKGVVSIEDPTPLEPIADWERELLVRERIADSDDEDLQWLIGHLDEDLRRALDLTDTVDHQLTEEIAAHQVTRMHRRRLEAENERLQERLAEREGS